MIVRIATEGQYRVNSALLDRLNELDNRLIQLVASDVILPAPDTTLDEAKSLFVNDGLIPD